VIIYLVLQIYDTNGKQTTKELINIDS